MQKKLKSLLMVASFVMAAALVFIACGEGKVLEVAQIIQEVDASGDIMQIKILNEDTLIWGSNYEPIPPDPPSSANEPVSSANEPVSSAVVPGSSTVNPPSSANVPSSSSNTVSPSSSSSAVKSSSSQATTTTGCKESNPKSGFTCGWNVKSNLTPGVSLKPESGDKGGCTVVFKYVDDDDPMTLVYGCTEISESGITSEGSKKYILFAELTCPDGKHTNACDPKAGLSSKKTPGLKGACTWDKNPVPAKRGATPSGVSLEDTDQVCGTPKPSVVYKSGGKNWSTGELEPGTYDVEATVNCPAYDVVPTPCPALVANAGSDHIIELDCASTTKDDNLDKCKGTNEAVLKVEECVDLTVVNYKGDPRPAKVECNVGQGGNGSASIKLKGKAEEISSYYKAFDIGTFKTGENEFGTLCLVSGGPTITCKIVRH